MQLVAAFSTAHTPARAVVAYTRPARVAVDDYVDALAYEIVPAVNPSSATDLIRARSAVQLYSAVDTINSQPNGQLDVFA